MTNNSRGKGFTLVLLAAVLWGTTGTSQGLAPEGVSSALIGTLRILTGGIVLSAYAIYKKSFSKNEQWPLLITAYGIISVAMYQITFFYGVSYSGVAVGTMVGIGSAPVSAGILSFIFYKETLSRRWFFSTFIAISGLVMISYGSGKSSIDYSLIGIILCVGAGFFYSSYTMVSKKLLVTNNENSVMAVLFTGGALILFPVLFVSDISPLVNIRGMSVVLHLGIFATALSYFFFARGLKIIKVSETATLSLAEPLTATLLGITVLKEAPGFLNIAGVVLIFSGLCVLSLPVRKNKLEY